MDRADVRVKGCERGVLHGRDRVLNAGDRGARGARAGVEARVKPQASDAASSSSSARLRRGGEVGDRRRVSRQTDGLEIEIERRDQPHPYRGL